MRHTPDPAALPSRRGRRIVIALLILLLILLPLYLWPLRGEMSGPSGAAALSGPPRDPRNPRAMAGIPSDVWDALMGGTSGGPATPPKPNRNLTMIAELEAGKGPGLPDVGESGAPFSILDGPTPRGTLTTALLEGPSSDPPGGKPSDEGPGSSPSSRDQGTGNGWPAFGGYPGLPNIGPFGGGGPGLVSSPGWTFDPGDSGSPAPTPEPATIVLVGSNLALLGAMAWKRRHGREETDTSG
jgi:hypothetical protein